MAHLSSSECRFGSSNSLIVCTSCKTSYNVLRHFQWGLGQFVGAGSPLKFPGGGGGVVVKKRGSPDFRSPEAGISGDLWLAIPLDL